MIKQQYVISGKVQGVGFRLFVEQVAKEMNIKGYVKNLDDGKVEVVAFFDLDDQVDSFEKLLEDGNEYSKIEKIEKKLLDKKYPFTFKDFKTNY